MSGASTTQDANPWRPRLWVAVGLIIAVVLWLGSPTFIHWMYRDWYKWDELGVIGDTFGFINAFFSGVALLAVVVSIWYQRQELKDTREELRRAAAAQEIASSSGVLQRHLSIASAYATVLQKMGADLKHNYSSGSLQPDFFIDPQVTKEGSIGGYVVLLRLCDYLDVAADALESVSLAVDDNVLRRTCTYLIRANTDEWILRWVKDRFKHKDTIEKWLPRHFVLKPDNFSTLSVAEELALLNSRYARYQKLLFA